MKCTDRNCPQYGGEAAHWCVCRPLLPSEKPRGEDYRLLNPLGDDQRTVAERKWNAPTMGKVEQKPCDAGLFSDDSKQGRLI